MDLVEEMEVQELPYQYVNLRKTFNIETRPKNNPCMLTLHGCSKRRVHRNHISILVCELEIHRCFLRTPFIATRNVHHGANETDKTRLQTARDQSRSTYVGFAHPQSSSTIRCCPDAAAFPSSCIMELPPFGQPRSNSY